jgi:hypothetical protein
MKPSKIQRDIQSPHARKMGSSPVIGKVSRLRDRETPGGRKSRRKGRRGSLTDKEIYTRRRLLLILSVGLVILTLAVIGGFLALWLGLHPDEGESANPMMKEEAMRITSKFASPGENEALELVKKALAIRKPAEVGTCIRPGGATAEEVVEFLKNADNRDGHIESINWLSSMDVEGFLIDGVLVSYTKDKETNARLAMLVPDDTGVWKLDFDAFARSSRPSWNDLITGKSDQAEVRVFVAKDTYFNGPFNDEKNWVCYAMTSPDTKSLLPDGKDLLRGYCKTGSPQAKAMERILTDDIKTNRATLQIKHREGADLRQFEIIRVLAQDWVLPPNPFDEKFR